MSNENALNTPNLESSINKKHEWFRLTKQRATLLLIYLISITILSSISLIFLIIDEINPFKSLSIFSLSIISAIATSLVGSSIYYSRKLYKACINQDMLIPQNESDKFRQLGVTSYYLSRPLYSACLSIVACIALRTGTEFISSNGVLNPKFPYLVMIISFFVGYSSSDFIDELEAKGKKVVNGVIKTDNK